ncbi:uncharacterized protein LTR77_001859 [Saxophila tyrrhenica]|uniref:NADP-dependent oxidoreductase domain-containing protein n=1 Tax=Saxophila tyrrhenica TaxID=1690608 RepID=A0AAV9PPS3_9PEZI|nr:hypothetical protein LTR77_001859 [Saxophila tyrrhenica]
MKAAISLLPLAVLATAQLHYAEQKPLEGQPVDEIPIAEKPFSTEPLSIDQIPLLGFGTWNLKENCTEAVSYAIQQGYRHIDCAAAYGNEFQVGRGIAEGLAVTGLTRADLWITSKLWNDHHNPNQVEAAIDDSLQKLGVGYLDLYHMHWPVKDGWFGRKYIDYVDTWGAMVLLKDKGKARHIGVSNFSPHQMEDLLKNTSVVPAVHQMELHPYLQQSDFVEWHSKHGIHVTAYSPLAGTNPTYDTGNFTQLLNNTVVTKIASKRDCTPAQVLLAWGMGRGTSVIPKTSHFERVKENFGSLECELKDKDVEKIDKLGKAHKRYNNPSKSWGLDLYEDLEDSKGEHKKHS